MHTNIHTHTHAHTYTHMYAYTYTHIHTCTRTHTCHKSSFSSLKIFNYEIFKSKYFRFLARNENIFIRTNLHCRNYTELADFVAVKR